MLNAVAENAARLCAAEDASIRLIDGSLLRLGSHYGTIPMAGAEQDRPVNRESVMGRAVVDRQLIHVEDLLPLAGTEFNAQIPGRDIHTMVATPLLREGVAIGVIGLRRTVIRPFTDKQIALLKTFANQAAIAIENVRLFKELQERNRQLTDALEQQTATGEILQVIASSPTDTQPVLDTIAESAARLCDSYDAVIQRVDGDFLQRVAHFGPVPVGDGRPPLSISRDFPSGRAIVDRQTVHVDDVLSEIETEFPDAGAIQQRSGSRTVLATPLLSKGVPIGVLMIRRTEVRPFADKQINLLKTFADQAVIAIENVRLFQELEEALEQQTATSEILGVIASSPTDIQPVLNTVAANAARLCESTDAEIRLVDGDGTRLVASFGTLAAAEFRPMSPRNVSGRAILTRRTVHVHDLQEAVKTEFPESVGVRFGVRTFLSSPMLREGILLLV